MKMKKNSHKRTRLGIGNKNDDIGTPKEFYDQLNEIYHFDFDPCPLKCTEFDGLEIDWKESNFVNPPYSKIGLWLRKAIKELEKGKKSVFLIPVRSQSQYWRDLIFPFASYIDFITGGIRFEPYKNISPMPMCLVVFDPKDKTNRPIKPMFQRVFIQ